MAHWFHRNPLKATTVLDFKFEGAHATGNTSKLCGEMRRTRCDFLEKVANPNHEITTVHDAADQYLARLRGMVENNEPVVANGAQQGQPQENKLRSVVQYKWTNTLKGNTPAVMKDAIFDQCGVVLNLALWYTKHAAKLAGKDEPNMEEAKEVHKCLKIAAGCFKYVKEELVHYIKEEAEHGSDLDPRILDCYMFQCQAEAQEVTIARAIELNHSSSLIAALANETGQLFEKADYCLTAFEDIAKKWSLYLKFKSNLYLAYAYNYHGQTLLAGDKCGDAISCLKEGITKYDKATEYAREYSAAKGPGTAAKPQSFPFFMKVGPILRRTAEKCERENGFIYHQKIPIAPPPLELKATHGLVAPEEFKYPDLHADWTAPVFDAFNKALATKPTEDSDNKKEKEKEKEKKEGTKETIPPVKEAEIPQSLKDPKNNSGCVVS